jgi:hypothetical protein
VNGHIVIGSRAFASGENVVGSRFAPVTRPSTATRTSYARFSFRHERT